MSAYCLPETFHLRSSYLFLYTGDISRRKFEKRRSLQSCLVDSSAWVSCRVVYIFLAGKRFQTQSRQFCCCDMCLHMKVNLLYEGNLCLLPEQWKQILKCLLRQCNCNVFYCYLISIVLCVRDNDRVSVFDVCPLNIGYYLSICQRLHFFAL